MMNAREIAKELAKTMRCNCDLDNWEPEKTTGHSWVCRIHKAAMSEYNNSLTNRCPGTEEEGCGMANF